VTKENTATVQYRMCLKM